MSAIGRRAMSTLSASSSHSSERVQNRNTRPARTTAATTTASGRDRDRRLRSERSEPSVDGERGSMSVRTTSGDCSCGPSRARSTPHLDWPHVTESSTDHPHAAARGSGQDSDRQVVVIGAGPAGLTAAYELGKAGVPATVLEADTTVGGISRTVERDGWRFDLGGHRFFTKVRAVEDLWHEILPDGDFLTRPRMSRIYYDGKFFDYPLRAFNVLRTVGIVEAFRCLF